MTTAEQTSMWLPEVEAHPQPSTYADLIRMAKESGGREHWQIWIPAGSLEPGRRAQKRHIQDARG